MYLGCDWIYGKTFHTSCAVRILAVLGVCYLCHPQEEEHAFRQASYDSCSSIRAGGLGSFSRSHL